MLLSTQRYEPIDLSSDGLFGGDECSICRSLKTHQGALKTRKRIDLLNMGFAVQSLPTSLSRLTQVWLYLLGLTVQMFGIALGLLLKARHLLETTLE